jgi:hypothetical protein
VTLLRALALTLGTAAVVTAPIVQHDAFAQGRRVVRRAAPPRAGGVVVAAYYRPLFLSPYYYDPFYDPWWYPYPYGWGRRYGYGYGYGYPAFREDSASLRLEVTPRETEVYVDGHYAGVVDDFDGMFQRLHIEPGTHEVTLYLPGYRSASQRVFLQHDRTFRIRHEMERRPAGEADDARPAAAPRAAPQTTRDRDPDLNRPPDRGAPSQRDNAVRGDSSFGAIAIRVQPADAEVFIDGERWDGPSNDEALVVQVAPGPHRVEVRRDGYRTYTGEVTVTAAETSPVNISLSR